RRKVIIGPTSSATFAFGIHPVGITKAVMSPQAMNAAILGITIPAMNPPSLWTLARTPPPAAVGTGTGSAIDIATPPSLVPALVLPHVSCGPSQGATPASAAG